MTDPRTPTLYLIGAAKAGTTTLAHHLRQHPEIFMTQMKEPHFFDDDPAYAKGVPWYLETHFAGSEGFRHRGEATPRYLHEAKVVGRLAAVTPAPRLIAILRHPVARAWSAYRHRVRTGEERRPFAEALAVPGGPMGYVEASRYGAALAPWIERFGREALHVMRLEDLAADPDAALAGLWAHLGVAAPGAVERTVKNAGGRARSAWLARAMNAGGWHKRVARRVIPRTLRRAAITKARALNSRAERDVPPPAPEAIAALQARLAEDLDRLQVLTGLDVAPWRAPPERRVLEGSLEAGVR